jgi:hypothetical protein
MASKQTAAIIEKTESRKRNMAMAFASYDEKLGMTCEGAASKRLSSLTPLSAKAVLLTKAAKLQAGGLDGL